MNYILQSIFSIDIFQEISTLYIHKVFFIRSLVGPVNVEGKKENEQEEAEKKEEVEKKEEKEVEIDEMKIQGEESTKKDVNIENKEN